MVSRRAFMGTGIAAGGLAAAGGATLFAYSRAMASAGELVDPGLSRVVPSRFGDLEYAEAGEGTPLLMIHGTGGGFDQGLLFARRLSESGYRVIAPSRFGYLRSAFPGDPSSENQADALVDLLDHLGIDRIAVAGGSAGALPALAFALRHPDRCTALVPLVPATYAPNRPPARPFSPTQQAMTDALLNSDFLFWSVATALPDVMIGTLLGTDPELLQAASPAERDRVTGIMTGLMPVTRRSRGLRNDARLAGNPAPMPIERITAPTLAISLEDDRFLTADAARHIGATVPGARAIIYPDGGHVWVGRDEEIFGAIDSFLRDVSSP